MAQEKPGFQLAVSNSPLARLLLLLFFTLALVETAFISVLCCDIMSAEKAALKELRIVRASQNVSSALVAARRDWLALARVYDHPETKSFQTEYFALRRKFTEMQQLATNSLREIGMHANSIDELDRQVQLLNHKSEEIISASGEARTQAEEEYQMIAWQCSKALLRFMRQIHKLGSDPIRLDTVLGIDPLQLLYAAALANLLLLGGMILFIHRSISRPISRLYADCERIKLGQSLAKPELLRSEIGILQNSFYKMSEMIVENEKRRKSYLEFLQEVQTAAMLRVRNCLDQLAGSSSLTERGLQTLNGSRKSLSMLIQILQSMAETLQDTETIVLHCQSANTMQLLQTALAAVESLVEKKKINVVINAADEKIIVDPMLVGRVLVNLLSNAIKYSPDSAEIKVDISRTERFLRFSVRDFGPGMTREEQAKLFKKFSQVAAADGVKRAGSGLGLLICKRIVEAHGGEITCESEPQKGSCFWFTMPLDGSATQRVSTEQKNEKSPTAERRFAKLGKSSINSKFALLLLVFLAMQSVAFVSLQGNLSESIERAHHYAEHKNKLFDAQDLFALFLLWGKQTEAALGREDYLAVSKTLPLLKEQINKAAELLSSSEPRSEAALELANVLKEQNHLLKFANYVISHLSELSGRINEMIRTASEGSGRIEGGIDRVIKLENANFQTSFDWSQRLRFQMLFALMATAFGDLVVIAFAAFTGLRIAERISVLKMKADAFGQGQQIAPSLSGADELSHLDSRLCQLSAELHEAEVRRQELLAVINHDLRTPLTSILGTFELCELGILGPVNESEAELVAGSQNQLEHMIAEVNDLLTIEKIDAGKFEIHSKSILIDELLDECMTLLTEKLKAKGTLLSIEPEANLLQAKIKGDRQLLVRLCVIVLANAIEASPNGEQVKLRLRQEADQVVASIEDHGTGITQALLPEIFERFRFLDGKPLTGLGLPLAHRLCRLHGGSIQIKSSDSNGTAVEIAIPLSA